MPCPNLWIPNHREAWNTVLFLIFESPDMDISDLMDPPSEGLARRADPLEGGGGLPLYLLNLV